MIITTLISAYKNYSSKRDCVLFRSIKRYVFDRSFRISVMIRLMLDTRFMLLKKVRQFLLLKRYGCEISCYSKIDGFITLPHPNGVVIGEKVEIGCNCTIYQGVTIGKKNGHYPVIGNNVTIYPNSVVFGNILIGNNSIIGAGTILNKSINENVVVAGNPARIIN